jgi:hypothetical protein
LPRKIARPMLGWYPGAIEPAASSASFIELFAAHASETARANGVLQICPPNTRDERRCLCVNGFRVRRGNGQHGDAPKASAGNAP